MSRGKVDVIFRSPIRDLSHFVFRKPNAQLIISTSVPVILDFYHDRTFVDLLFGESVEDGESRSLRPSVRKAKSVL